MVFADYRGCLVQKIVAYIGYCTVQTLDFGFELLPVGGKLHSFCQLALQLCQLLFMFSETVQWFDAGTIGERCKTRNSHIYANGALRSVYRFWNFPFRLNRNKPSASGQGNCYLFRCSFYPAAVAIADIADFGQKYAAVVFIEPETLRIAEGVMNPLSLETREIRTLGKEVFVGPVKIFQRLLQNLRMGFSKKRCVVFLLPVPKGFAEQGKPQTLPFLFISLFFQCKRLVPKETATSGKTPHEAFLPGFGAELELVGLQSFHSRIIVAL